MEEKSINTFIKRMETLSDEDLLKVIEKKDEYQPEAKEAAIKVALERKIINADFEPITKEIQEDIIDIDEWHYELNGSRKGPINKTEIIKLIKENLLNEENLIWKKDFHDWTKLKDTDFKIFFYKNLPPPLTGNKVNNTFIWILAFAPIWATILEHILFEKDSILFWIAVNSVLAIIDDFKLKKAGHHTNNLIWAFVFIPVYLWRRASLTKQSKSYFWVWIVSLILSVLVLQEYDINGNQTSFQDESIHEEYIEENVATYVTFNINEEIQIGDYIIQVSKILDPYNPKDVVYSPEKGNKFVAIEVIYKNNSTSPFEYNAVIDWKLIDSEGYTYDFGLLPGGKEPLISYGTINPNGKVKGWLTFETLKESQNFSLQFDPLNQYTISNVEIKLN